LASEEANRILGLIYDDFFSISNIACLGFFRSDGTPVSVSLEPYDRVADVSFVSLSATIDLASFSSALAPAACSPAVQHCLKLPQSSIPPKSADAPGDAHAHHNTVSAVNDDDAVANANKTPPAAPSNTKAMTAICNHFVRGGVIANVDATNQRFIQALAALVQTPSLNATPHQLIQR
jgi:hypothetical protein